MNEVRDKKIIITGLLLVMTVLLSISGMTYAWFSASVNKDNVSSVTVTMANLRIIYKETSNIYEENIIPGWSGIKTFEIENLSKKSVAYKIELTDIVNTFLRSGDVTYTLESTNGGCKVEESEYPTEDIEVCEGTIGIGAKQEFTLTINYKYEEEIDQSSDMGKRIGGKIKIEGTEIEDDIGIIALYVNNEPVKEIDQSKTYQLVSSECTNGARAGWDGINSVALISNITKITGCRLYLIEAPYLYNKIIADNNGGISDLNVNFAGISGAGLYYTSDLSYGEYNTRIYYYRGDIDNNWVNLGGYKWRIVRTTSEEGVKLIYSGDGETTKSGFIYSDVKYNNSENSSSYTKYGGSNVKSVIDGWYSNWIQTQTTVPNYLSETAVYCNDTTGSTSAFGAYTRLYTNKRPSYTCSTTGGISSVQVNSTYTKANGQLTYPIALLSTDEVSYAGLVYNSPANGLSYIMDNAANNWWTMSPYYFANSTANVWYVNTWGLTSQFNVAAQREVRPSVSLKSCVTFAGGDGSKATPYEISYSTC